MQRHELEHIIRASAGITGRKRFIIVGSEALLGQFPDAPDELLVFDYVAALVRRHMVSLAVLAERLLATPLHPERRISCEGRLKRLASLPTS